MISKTMWALGANRNVIRELFEYGQTQRELVGPENVFDYSLGNPSIPSPPEVNDAIRAILAEYDSMSVHGYTSAGGSMEARTAIADDLNRRFHVNARPMEVFITCGAAPGLVAALAALHIDENTEIIALAPYFPEYKPFTECTGSKLVVVPADTVNFQIDFAALEARISSNTQAVIVNSPNNPAGTVYTADTIRALGDLLTRKGEEFGHPIYILADEPYRELVYGDAEVPFIPNIYPNTVVCYSYSKSLSLPGERIGYVFIPRCAADCDALSAAVAGAARISGHVCAPSLWQKVIVRCAHLRPDLESYDRNRLTLWNALTDMGYRVAKPDGAFYLFVEAPNGDDLALSQMAKKYNLLLVPGTGFGCPGWFRICYAVDLNMIRRSLPAFRALMDEIKNEENQV